MANFIGRSGTLFLFTSGDKAVIVDSTVDVIIASGSSEVLSSSNNWEDGEAPASTFEIASQSLNLDDITVTASARRMYTIPRGIKLEAQKALKWRKEFKRGGTDVGLGTARTLAEGGQIGLEKVRHIAKYFPRHEVDKQGMGWSPGEEGFPSNGRIAWALWGGDAGERWASAIVERENKNAITADAYGYARLHDHTTPDVHAFEKAYELDDESGPEFLVRVRLDGSGMDRLYKIDHDGEVYLWDDGCWDNFGRIGNNIWDYDKSLDHQEDLIEKSHIVIDPESAIVIASNLYARPFENVRIEDIDNHETRLAAAAVDGIDWDFLDQTLTAAGTPADSAAADGIYTEEERSKNASSQLRDASGLFAKMGGRVMVGGDPRGTGQITNLNRATGKATVALDNGRSVEVDSKLLEGIDNTTVAIPGRPVEIPRVDVTGILGEPRTPVDRASAQLPGTLPALTSSDLHSIISDFPAWVTEQRAQFKATPTPSDVVVQGRNSSNTKGGNPITDARQHPLVRDWLNKSNRWTGTSNTLWSGPLTSAGDVKTLTPETADVQPLYMAVVDQDDPRAVLALISLVPATSTSVVPTVYSRKEGKWVLDPQTLADLNSATPPPVVPLDSSVLNDVLKQVDTSQGVDAEKAAEDKAAEDKAVEPISASLALMVLFGDSLTAAGKFNLKSLAAEKLRKYWTTGKGGAKIRWGTGGDWKRCVRHLSKYMGSRSKGYCQLRHKDALGFYTSTHAKMIRNNSIGQTSTQPTKESPAGSYKDFTEITEEELLIPIEDIGIEEDKDFDPSFEPPQDIIDAASEVGTYSEEEFALVAAGGLDRNRGGAEKLRKYWTTGKGGAKIRWGSKGDWTRCVRQLSKYLGPRSKGYCALRHKEMNGIWPGDKRNLEMSYQESAGRVYSSDVLKDSDEVNTGMYLSARRQDAVRKVNSISGRTSMSEFGYSPEEDLTVEDTIMLAAAGGPITATAGSKSAPKKDQIKGSDRNKKGSAGTGASVSFTVAIEKSLSKKVSDHNEKAGNGRKANLRTLKAVYRRGAGAFSTSHRPDQNRNSWAMARVNAFLHLLKTGSPKNTKYTTDNDLLPASHPKSSKGEASTMVAGGQISEGGQFYIPLVIPEEMESGDGRMFLKNSITMRDLPLPLMWQIKTGDGHSGSVVVGRIDSMERTDQGIGNAYGVFDASEFGKEAERMVQNGFLRGVSADMDKFEAEEQSSKTAEDDENPDKIKKDKITINKARVMGVTIVAKPAFQECSISLVNNPEDTSQEDAMIEDGIYVDEVDPREAAAVVASAMIAGAIPNEPPTNWFEDPKLKQPTPLTVDNMGRVFGHIAAWNVDHIGMVAGTKPPRSRSGYQYFHTGVCRTDDGSDVAVGQLTLAGGHASIEASAAQAARHYDDTASAIADVHAGEDEFGIWVAGSLRAGASPDQIRALRASAPSGDWRPIHGRLELVAVCQVNVPGFPIARARVASGQVVALVAAGAYALAKLREDPMTEMNVRLARLEADKQAPLVAAAQAAKEKIAVIRAGGHMGTESKTILVETLENLLADVVTTYFCAHGYHWNVQGEDFAQYHKLFGKIYEDIYESIDPLGENIRKLGATAPMSLADIIGDSPLHDTSSEDVSPKTLAYNLYMMNEDLVLAFKAAFDLADAVNEQGVANFLAERIDSHQKWCWQLRSSIVPEEMELMSGSPEDATPESIEQHYNSVFSTLEEQGIIASAMKTRKFTTSEREAMAKKGQALPDGSFPIANVEDLKNAIQAYGRASVKKKPAVKAHITKRAKALKQAALIPQEWAGAVKPKAKAKSEFSVTGVDDLRARIASITASLETNEEK